MTAAHRSGTAILRTIGAGLCAGVGFLAASGSAQGPGLAMLEQLEPGLWEVQPRDDTPRVRICVDSGRKLIQIRHAQEVCRRFVIEDRPEVVTVQYTCPANGYGHTRIRFENARLAQIETQGIERGLPFNFAAEARRIGACER